MENSGTNKYGRKCHGNIFILRYFDAVSCLNNCIIIIVYSVILIYDLIMVALSTKHFSCSLGDDRSNWAFVPCSDDLIITFTIFASLLDVDSNFFLLPYYVQV